MKVITYHVKPISRGKGRSAVQLAAYCARDKLVNHYNGRSYDYTMRRDLVYHEILLPNHAPRAFYDNQTLWNNVEQIEKNRNARLARSVYFSLPKELGADTHIDMTCIYIQKYFVDRGMCADFSLHDKGDGNPHVHVMLTTRSLDENGEWSVKQRRNYLRDECGARILNPQTNRYKLGRSLKTNDWDAPGNVEIWRNGWADICNVELARQGHPPVTHMSYARQGMDQTPTLHLGARAKALKDRGILTDRAIMNREIEVQNRLCRRLERQRNRDKEYHFDRSW